MQKRTEGGGMSLFLKGIFGIAGGSVGKNGWLVVLGVFVGTYFWWGRLTAVVAFARRKKRTESFQKTNRIFQINFLSSNRKC